MHVERDCADGAEVGIAGGRLRGGLQRLCLAQLGVQFIQGYFVNAPEEVTITDTQTLRTLSSTPAAPPAPARPNSR